MLCITEIKTAVQVTENVVTEEFKINQEILLTPTAFKMQNFSPPNAKE